MSDYCAYAHLSAMLGRSGRECLIAMFEHEVYFDDSGTDDMCDVAVAACYISTKTKWDSFVEALNVVRQEEGFIDFHMSHFMAPRHQNKEPWCHWDKPKKTRVYNRVANIINEAKLVGIACAVPKKPYDALPFEIREHHGLEHYTFAVRTCFQEIAKWREASGTELPMRYVFDWEMQKTPKRTEISAILDEMHESWEKIYGFRIDGYGFEHKEVFKPLQAADVLAWQMRRHMDKIMMLGRDDESLTHDGFRLLREDQKMDLGFYTSAQLAEWLEKHKRFEGEHGRSIYEVYDEQKRVQKVRRGDESTS